MESLGAADADPDDPFLYRHLGSDLAGQEAMLKDLGFETLDALSQAAVPSAIQMRGELSLPTPGSEPEVLAELRSLLGQNRRTRSFIGQGYVPAHLPLVLQRNILENPAFYTPYTPYQAEIAQGRLEALLNFQTMISSLTGLGLANASLLDEATAAAEAMLLCRGLNPKGSCRFLAAEDCHPQTLQVLQTRARHLGIEVVVGSPENFGEMDPLPFAVLIQQPSTHGLVRDLGSLIQRIHQSGAMVILAVDPLALTLLASPGELNADVAIGTTQRLGLPLGMGGPHAAFLATRLENRRLVPGRIVGVSHDSAGKVAYRLALQTREQHIRRERATSNICTAQVLPAVLAAFYAIHHGPEGLRSLARRVTRLTRALAQGLRAVGFHPTPELPFDTLQIPLSPSERQRVLAAAAAQGLALRSDRDDSLGLTLGETTTLEEVEELLAVFAPGRSLPSLPMLWAETTSDFPAELSRKTQFLEQPVFGRYHSEHELLRYIKRLESRDLSLTTSMIPLGSCTMKLNGTAEMVPLTWPELSEAHPFVDPDTVTGTRAVLDQLAGWLAEIVGLAAVSLQPNSGAQGEYTGLLVIRTYHEQRGESQRDICLIPTSAHGTNPASATLAGLRVVTVACDTQGNVDLADLRQKAEEHGPRLAALMVTYPSTHGVFEESIREICQVVHQAGGQVYLDGANLNAQVGLCRPGDYGADVCHINLHKTFCIPHGGGGPGMGPIAVASHLVPYLPVHGPKETQLGPVSAAPQGSASLAVIPWVYVRLMGARGLRRASQVALLNANYMAKRLQDQYQVLYRGVRGCCAHEFILDFRPFKKSAGIEVDDVAKRLMDYGFHAPTMSFPVPGTLMIEPTESESREELDRFCDALSAIREEIRLVETGQMSPLDNPLKNAPHTLAAVTASEWRHPYSREQAAFPLPYLLEHKFWPAVGRIDNAAGDRNLVCTCQVE